MSRASSWARKGRRQLRFREHLTAYDRRRRNAPLVATVGLHGDLLIGDDDGSHTRLRPSECRRLARWLLRVFGE